MDKPSSLRAKVLVKNSLWTTVGWVLTVPFTFFLVPYMLGHLSVEQYGIWALAGVVTTFAYLSDLGISRSVTKFVSEYVGQSRQPEMGVLLSTVFLVLLALGIVPVFIVVLFRYPIVKFVFRVSGDLINEAAFVLVGAACSFLLSLVFGVFMSLIDGLQRMEITSLIKLSSVILNFIGSILVLGQGLGLRGLILKNIAMAVLVGLIAVWQARRLLPDLRISWRLFSFQTVKGVLGFSLNLQVISLLGLGFDPLFRTLTINLGGVTSLAQYDIGARIANQVRTLFTKALTPILPAASELHGAGALAQLEYLYLTATRLVLLLALPAHLIGIIFGPVFIKLWLGAGYEDAGIALQALLLGWFLTLLATTPYILLQAVGKPRLNVYAHLGQSVAAIGSLFFLVPRYGYVGVPLAFVWAQLAGALIVFFSFHQSQHVSVAPILQLLAAPRVLAVNIVVGGSAALINQYWSPSPWGVLIASALTTGMVYLIALWLIGLRKEDKRLIANIVPSVSTAKYQEIAPP